MIYVISVLQSEYPHDQTTFTADLTEAELAGVEATLKNLAAMDQVDYDIEIADQPVDYGQTLAKIGLLVGEMEP